MLPDAAPQAVDAGMFGAELCGAVKLERRATRSLSAVTWSAVARTRGFPLAHHNVLFSTDYPAEFRALEGGDLAGGPDVGAAGGPDEGPGGAEVPAGGDAVLEGHRDVLVDHIRARSAQERGGDRCRVEIPDGVSLAPPDSESEIPFAELQALHQALEQLQARSPELAELVLLHIFGGLRLHEIAQLRGMSIRTVERHWQFSKTWLRAAMLGES